MLEKLKANSERLTRLLSVVSAALLVPSILANVDSELTEAGIVTLGGYLLLLAACILLFIPTKDIKITVPIANVLVYGSLAFRHAYSAISGSLSAYATALLYAAVAVLIFLPPCKKAYRITALISIAFFLASALGGGAVNLSMLLLSLLIAANTYLNMEKEP